ncbi:MAG: DinB family protein [Bacteroidia bacterium]
MSQSKQTATRIREVFLSGHWIANTNYKKELSKLSWEQATTNIYGLNTVAALTFHINYYLDGILRAVDTGSLDIQDKYSFDMPPVASEEEWSKLVDAFLANAEKFVAFTEHLPSEKLNAPFFNEKYGTYQRNIEAVIEHSYYHLGQISLINKMLGTHNK